MRFIFWRNLKFKKTYAHSHAQKPTCSPGIHDIHLEIVFQILKDYLIDFDEK